HLAAGRRAGFPDPARGSQRRRDLRPGEPWLSGRRTDPAGHRPLARAGPGPGVLSLTPRSDGLLTSERRARLPFMAPRLQGVFAADGSLDVDLWGAGRLGRVLTSVPTGPFIHGPNRVTWPGGGLHVAQSAPVLVVRGVGLRAMTPARRSAAWAPESPARPTRDGDRRSVDLEWG